MSVGFLTVEGEILSETRGGIESDYVPDPIGSTAALSDSKQAISDLFLWWPYGELRGHLIGSGLTAFGYVGTLGYYADDVSHCYVRANILRSALARWQSIDKLWPTVPPFAYAYGNPLTYIDPEGEKPDKKHRKKCPPGWKLVSVTCYGIADPAHPKSNSNAAYGRNPNCGGCDRKGRTGDCANDTSKGRKGVCGAGQTVTIAYPGNPPVVKAKCIVCDTGQGQKGLDIYVDVPDSDCGKYFNQTTYCVKCS